LVRELGRGTIAVGGDLVHGLAAARASIAVRGDGWYASSAAAVGRDLMRKLGCGASGVRARLWRDSRLAATWCTGSAAARSR